MSLTVTTPGVIRLPAPAGRQWRYWVGYFCPRGSAHFEFYASEDYDGCCGSKGWDVYLDAAPEDTGLPEGEWRLCTVT